MEFRIKCGVRVLRREKVVSSEELRMSKKMINCLCILEYNKIKEREEYLRQTTLIMKSIFNGSKKVMAINTWAVSLMRYGAGIVK